MAKQQPAQELDTEIGIMTGDSARFRLQYTGREGIIGATLKSGGNTVIGMLQSMEKASDVLYDGIDMTHTVVRENLFESKVSLARTVHNAVQEFTDKGYSSEQIKSMFGVRNVATNAIESAPKF